MSGLLGTVAALYEDAAAIYALVSDDRDFATQARFLAEHVARQPNGGRLLELCAGPARHAIELERRHGYVCHAVDASATMRSIATGPGGLDPARYHVLRLPRLPAPERLAGDFHAATVLRYSLGYLAPAEVVGLLEGLRGLLRPAGRLLIELHDLALVRNDFRGLEIRDRTVTVADGARVRCVWPAGPLRWRADDWIVEMDVAVEVEHPEGARDAYRWVSVERIYGRAEVAALAGIAGGWRAIDTHCAAFPGSVLLMLERVS